LTSTAAFSRLGQEQAEIGLLFVALSPGGIRRIKHSEQAPPLGERNVRVGAVVSRLS